MAGHVSVITLGLPRARNAADLRPMDERSVNALAKRIRREILDSKRVAARGLRPLAPMQRQLAELEAFRRPKKMNPLDLESIERLRLAVQENRDRFRRESERSAVLVSWAAALSEELRLTRYSVDYDRRIRLARNRNSFHPTR